MRRAAVLVALVAGVAAAFLTTAGSSAKDRTPPTAPRIIGPKQTESRFPIFTFISRDAVTPRAKLRYRCAFDSTKLHACAARYSQQLLSGRHVLRAQAVDLAGNRSRITVFPVIVALPPPPAPGESREAQLARVRAATERYRSVDAAKADGYVQRGECVMPPQVAGATVGAMGIHFAHPGLMADDALEPERPEIILYFPRANGLELTGVEYHKRDADQVLTTSEDLPKLFGVNFDGPMPGHDAAMPVHYDLHVWLYRSNPAGMFNPFNPDLRCP